MKHFLTYSVAILGAVSAFPTAARADALGAASGYNVFAFTSMSRSNVDAEGTVAVGGNATFTNFGINNKNAPGPALVVGGNLSYNGGEVHHGSTVVAGAISGSVNSPNGTVASGVGAGGLPFDFATGVADLKARSTAYGTLTPNGTSSLQYGGLTLTGTNSGTNVFSLNASTFGGLNNLAINAPSGSSVVINVTGDAAAFQYFGMNLNGVTRNDVLFNFLDATAITVNGFSFQGSMLAPFATLNHNNGNIEGQTIVNAIAPGNGEFHWHKFNGPPPPGGLEVPPGGTPVPAPPGVLLAGLAAACGLGFSRRRW